MIILKNYTYLILFVLLASVIAAGCTSSDAPEEQTTVTTSNNDEPVKETSSSDEPVKEIVSTSFSDFALYSDSTATALQKESFFDDNYKGKYVTWSGTVASVGESMGSYTVSVKHSSRSLISDVTVVMRDDQKDKLLQLKEGSKITYTAKLTSYGELLGIYGEDGTIDVEPVKEAVTPTKDTPISDKPVKATSSNDEPIKETSSSEEPQKEIVSTSFSDFALYSDSTATALQKESFFDDNYKGKYVTWSGTVASVGESMGSYTVSVKHSSRSLISDVTVVMRDDQKDKLLQLKEGSKITYTAKLTSYGELLGIYGEDGTIE